MDAAASGMRRRDQGEMNLVRSGCVLTDGANTFAKLLGAKQGEAAYGKTVWS
ncbi:hypothetical protein GGD63_005113 [Bradyrhizobium sp. cir1]|nr:hypothetical protein [Bradyrhizobium sp. cir1]